MSWNAHFIFAVHALALIAATGDTPLNSEIIAASVNTNAVVIRRILCDLARANLVISQVGAGGGFRLRKMPRAISMLEIYQATDSGSVFCMRRRGKKRPSSQCPVGRNIDSVMRGVHQQADRAMQGVLSAITLEDVLHDLKPESEGTRIAGRFRPPV